MQDEVKMTALKNKSEMLKAIAHPMRLCILNCLMTTEDCNVTTLAKKMDKPQSTISQHLSKLKSHGLIEGDRNGVEIQYRVVEDDVKEIIKLLLKDLTENKENEQSLSCK